MRAPPHTCRSWRFSIFSDNYIFQVEFHSTILLSFSNQTHFYNLSSRYPLWPSISHPSLYDGHRHPLRDSTQQTPYLSYVQQILNRVWIADTAHPSARSSECLQSQVKADEQSLYLLILRKFAHLLLRGYTISKILLLFDIVAEREN